MTTTVKVEAHVTEDKEVLVTITDNLNIVDQVILQDGDSVEKYIYGNQVISITEKEKDD